MIQNKQDSENHEVFGANDFENNSNNNKRRTYMKTINRLVVIMLTAVALMALSIPAQAYNVDSRIESTARKSYVFKVFLQNDDIKIESKDGQVTLTGVVADNFNKSRNFLKRDSV